VTVTPAELREVIRRIEARTGIARPTPRRSAAALEDLVEGEVEETERGAILVVRRRYPASHVHGRAPLDETRGAAPEVLALLTRAEAPPPDISRLVFLDTETTGLAGGTGTYAFMVGAGFFDDGAFEVRQYFMRDLDEEPALLAALDALFQRFEGIVTYNGGGFDLPLLETRFVLGRRRWRDQMFHLDLLPAARRLWRDRLSDCRLGTVEQHVLGFGRADDLPGAMIPYAYFDYLRRKRPGEIPRVFEHNRHDILSLAALTGWVTGAIARAPAPELASWELAGLGALLEAVEPERGEACFRLALELGLAGAARERLLLRLAIREKRRRRWDESRALWGELASLRGGFDPRPWEEIAPPRSTWRAMRWAWRTGAARPSRSATGSPIGWLACPAGCRAAGRPDPASRGTSQQGRQPHARGDGREGSGR
jgi:uncharacterized protein YprB with RNaseH-like and TPR domain